MDEIIIERVNQGLCPICKELLEKEEIEFIDYNKTKQPVHKRHIKLAIPRIPNARGLF